MKKKEMWFSCDNGIYHFVILFQSYNVMPKICERGPWIKCRRRHFIYRMYNTLYCYTFISFFPFSFVYASIFNARWYLNICANNMRVLMHRLNQNIEMREKKIRFNFRVISPTIVNLATFKWTNIYNVHRFIVIDNCQSMHIHIVWKLFRILFKDQMD